QRNEAHMKVTLNVFSSRPNPSVILSGKLLSEFNERCADFKPSELQKPSGIILPLGYGGFTCTPTTRDGRELHIHSGRLGNTSRSQEFERWLLDVVNDGPVLFSGSFRRTLQSAICSG